MNLFHTHTILGRRMIRPTKVGGKLDIFHYGQNIQIYAKMVSLHYYYYIFTTLPSLCEVCYAQRWWLTQDCTMNFWLREFKYRFISFFLNQHASHCTEPWFSNVVLLQNVVCLVTQYGIFQFRNLNTQTQQHIILSFRRTLPLQFVSLLLSGQTHIFVLGVLDNSKAL